VRSGFPLLRLYVAPLRPVMQWAQQKAVQQVTQNAAGSGR
jgi:hypothetical protein